MHSARIGRLCRRTANAGLARPLVRHRSSRGRSFIQSDRLADHRHDQSVSLQQALGDALHVVERDGLDDLVALLDIVGAEAFLQQTEQLRRDLRIGIEAQRIRAGQIVLGSFEIGSAVGPCRPSFSVQRG